MGMMAVCAARCRGSVKAQDEKNARAFLARDCAYDAVELPHANVHDEENRRVDLSEVVRVIACAPVVVQVRPDVGLCRPA